MSLEQDYTTVPGQLFACLSVVGPEAPQKNDQFGIKIRGAFATRDEAANHAKRLQKEDATFDIYVVDMYKWLLIPPDPTKIEDVHYTNEKLEEIMSGYKENQAVFCFFHSGEVYHRGDCPSVDKYYEKIQKREAISRGYSACSICGG